MPETCIFYYLKSRKSFIRLDHATDQKCHFGVIRLRIFKMRWVSVANDHLGPKPLISDSATRRSLWPLECQSNVTSRMPWMTTSDKFQRHSFKVAFKLTAKSVRSHILTLTFLKIALLIKAHMRTWSLEPEPELELPEPYNLPGAGAGAGAAKQFYTEPGRSRSRSQPKMSRLRTPAGMVIWGQIMTSWDQCTFFLITFDWMR